MRSKVAQKIQEETPEEVRIFVRQYNDEVVRINEILQKKGYTFSSAWGLRALQVIRCDKRDIRYYLNIQRVGLTKQIDK